MLRIGVIGIGNMGTEHCRIITGGLTPETELAAVADVRNDRQVWAKRICQGLCESLAAQKN